MYDFVFKRFSCHLKSKQHRAPAVYEYLAFEQAVRYRKLAYVLTRTLHSIYAQRYTYAPRFAVRDRPKKLFQAERLRA